MLWQISTILFMNNKEPLSKRHFVTNIHVESCPYSDIQITMLYI